MLAEVEGLLPGCGVRGLRVGEPGRQGGDERPALDPGVLLCRSQLDRPLLQAAISASTARNRWARAGGRGCARPPRRRPASRWSSARGR